MQSSKHARASQRTPVARRPNDPRNDSSHGDDRTVASPDDERRAAKQAALRILRGAAQSEASLSRRLQRRGFSDEASHAAARSGYIDDTALARSIVDRRRSRRGTARIAAELRARGLDGDVVTAALDSVSPDEQRESAVREALRRLPNGLPANPADRRRQLTKVGAALSRLGFQTDLIAHALHAATANPEASE
jgi:regulatory protein